MDVKRAKFNVLSPLSTVLFQNLKSLYIYELHRGLKNGDSRNKIHIYSSHGITAFPLTIAIWESILNESFFSDFVKFHYSDNLLFQIENEAEKWDLKTKTIMFPKFLFHHSFDKSSSLFANLNTVIEIRNNIIHYKSSFNHGPENSIKDLRQRNITYPKPKNIDCAWQMELETTECIRFCINTIESLVKGLLDLETEFYLKNCPTIMPEIYKGISVRDVKKIFIDYDLDPDSIHKDFFENK